MHAITHLVSDYLQSSQCAALIFDAWLKSLVVLALAGALCVAWRRASAATRHLIWLFAVISLPCLPWLSASVVVGGKTALVGGNPFRFRQSDFPGPGICAGDKADYIRALNVRWFRRFRQFKPRRGNRQ